MPPILLHIVILLSLAAPIVVSWSKGQPAHQATAAAWAVGLLFMAGLWLTYAILSSGLIIWRYRVRRPTLLMVLGLHIASALILVVVFYLAAWILG